MIRVRSHTRQLGTGKMVKVRQHERSGDPRQEPAPVHEAGTWWDGSADPVPEGDFPPGTSFFRQAGGEVCAVHPDGAVYPVAQEDGEPDDDDLGLPPEMARLFGADTPEGAERYRRARDLRESGYAGPIDEDGCAAPAEPVHAPAAASDPALARMQARMRHWRSLPEPDVSYAVPDTSPLGRALGNDTREGAENFARLKAYREAGYHGPLYRDSRIPDPDDPANHESLSALARMSEI